MERLFRRRKCLRSQLDAIAQEAEGLLREPQLSSSQISISLDRINAIYAHITKIDESLVNETPEDLIEEETLDASNYGDKIVTLKSKLRFAIQNDREKWRKVRSLFNACFTAGKVKKLYPIIDGAVMRLVQKFDDASRFGNIIDGHETARCMVLETLTSTVLGREVCY
ncbi:hypothetical protein MTO96_041778 [Rhipicephalus appendiculatus]